MLFPAAVLIVMVLAAMAVDTSIGFLAQRELAEATAAAANDAAAEALAAGAFYQEDRIDLDAEAVREVAVARVLSVVDSDRHTGLRVEAEAIPPVQPGCPPRVRVSAWSTVAYVFARTVPGGPDTVAVHAAAVASPHQDDGPCS